ncbi:hypothetical protein K3495_g9913 [Podosphaera aphanis]|nr:hypothetical protein K3495_g9913 [Podosphaera aphanis]
MQHLQLSDFITELETQYGCRTKAFRSDNGGEYVNKDLSKFFAQKGIVHDLTPPYSPESNDIAERLNRSIGEAYQNNASYLEKWLGNRQTTNLPQLQDSQHESEISPQWQLNESTPTQPTSTTPLSDFANQLVSTQPPTRPRRTVRPRVFEDIITGEWWNKSNRALLAGRPVLSSPPNPNINETAMITILEVPEPKSYCEAKSSPYWDEWKKASDCEMESFAENNVCDIVPRPEGRNIVSGKWVCKVKGNAQGKVERFKARYVAKGFSKLQGLDFDETFAPVVRFDSLRLLLAIAAHKCWRPRQLNIKTAIPYGILNEETFMELPDGYRKENYFARLNRLVDYLLSFGLASTPFGPCVLVHNTGNLYLAVYVDGIILFGEPGDLMDQVVTCLKSEFKVNDMGTLHWILGTQIEYFDTGIALSQTAYIQRLLIKFGMHNSNSTTTPIEPNHRLRATQTEEDRADTTLYQQIVGSIMYLVSATRPDLAYTISHLSQFSSDPSTSHFCAAKRALRYVKGTADGKLFYKSGSPLILSGLCDASYRNCLDTRRSFSGYLFQLGESCISWKYRKQRTVALSTYEAEYMALSLAPKQFIWIARGLNQLLNDNVPSALATDNSAAIDLAHNPKIIEATKQKDICYHFIRELIENGSITLLHVPSAENLADICTKGLPSPRHYHLCTIIFGTK